MKFTLHIRIDDPRNGIKERIMDEVVFLLKIYGYSFDVSCGPNEIDISNGGMIMAKRLITTALLVFSILLSAIGIHTDSLIMTAIGGFCAGIYDSIRNEKEK